MEEDKIELYSEEVQDLLGTPPRWLVRWGTMVFLIVVGALITLSALVNYPDKVAAPIRITTHIPPTPIITRTQGNLILHNFEDGDPIQQNNILGIIENPANSQDVFLVEKDLKPIGVVSPTSILDFRPREKLQLGNLQSTYARTCVLFEEYIIASKANYDIRKIRQLQQQIENIQILNDTITRNQKTLEEAVAVAQSKLNRQKILLKDTTSSQLDVENARELYLAARRTKEQGELESMNNNLQINNIEREITSIKKNMKLTKSSKFLELSESIKNLAAEIESWKERYVLMATASGIVSMNPEVKTNQFVTEQVEVATILPKEEKIVGIIKLDMKGSGKVDTLNKVIIKFAGYPYQEYGIVRGTVSNKSALPRDNKFHVDVQLDNQLITSRGKELKFEQQIEGIAEIITDSRSILRRIFDQILTAFESASEA